MKVNVSNPKTGESVQKEAGEEQKSLFVGKKIGSEVQLDLMGLQGVVGVITGGSDKEGFPMRKDIQGTVRKKLVLESGTTGLKAGEKGYKQKKTVKGNTVSEETSQVNVRVKEDHSEAAKAFFEANKKPKEEKKA